MRRKLIFSSLVLLALVAGAAVWWLARPGSDVQGAGAGPASVPAPAAELLEKPEATAAVTEPEREPGDFPAPEQLWRRPTLGLSFHQRTAPAEWKGPGSARGQAVMRRKARSDWDEHIAPLVYPPGHPDEGRWLDSVTLDQAVEAQVGYWKDVLPGPEDHWDRRMLHAVKRIPYAVLNERIRNWNKDDVASSRRFYDWMMAQPDDPGAHPADMWIPADPDDPDAVTRSENLAARIRETELINFPEERAAVLAERAGDGSGS